MKRIELTIKEDGNYTINAMEGLVGQSCDQKTANLVSILGGVEKQTIYKPEYFDGNGDNLNELTNGGR